VYTRSGTTWTQQAKLTDPDGRLLDIFGFDVSLTTDRALIGAYRAKQGAIGRDAGAGFVFERSGGSWSLTKRLVSQSLQLDDALGFRVEIDGDLAVLGARGFENERGKFVHFRLYNGEWLEQGEGFASNGKSGDEFSYGMDLDGDRLVVGARLAKASAIREAGAVGIYHLYWLNITPESPQAGKFATASITSGTAETWTYLAASTFGPGFFPVPSLGVVLDLHAPVLPTYPKLTDAVGTVSWDLVVPPTASGITYWVQCMQMGRVTNVRSVVVQ